MNSSAPAGNRTQDLLLTRETPYHLATGANTRYIIPYIYVLNIFKLFLLFKLYNIVKKFRYI